jgi:hypothetical protein
MPMLCVIYAEFLNWAHYAEFHLAECRYAEFRNAECRGAVSKAVAYISEAL